MKHDEQAKKDFIQFWRNEDNMNAAKLKVISEFERDYSPQKSIWWYSRECFIYEMLNWSLRMLEAGTIVTIGFFICDLHRQIQCLQKQQISLYDGKVFQVFRGQGLSTADFEKLQKNKGGLIAFNNFLSTSKTQDVSLGFARGALGKPEVVGILFEMTIDPGISSASFASIREESYFKDEDEILFSMHSIFRIGDIRKLDNNSPLYQVDLILTSDDDQQLRQLTESIQEDDADKIDWSRLGKLLLSINKLDKAKELYLLQLKQSPDDNTRAAIYHNLGVVKDLQGRYKEAAAFYEEALEIKRKTLPEDHSSLAPTFSNIGLVYKKMSDYLKAVEYYEKAHKIYKKALTSNHPDLAMSYNNIGLVYDDMNNFSKALEHYEKSHTILLITLPPNHPKLATSYNNI
ncbi:unnamed protein product, partial [Rotaria sp. Silwood1]